jgi:hypothetical protein
VDTLAGARAHRLVVGNSVKQVEMTIHEDASGALSYDHILPENSAARNPEAPDYNTGPGESGSFGQIPQTRDNLNRKIAA